MIIIGITGSQGAGKGMVVEYLVEKYGFIHYSARKFLTEEITRRGLPVSRDSMTSVGNELRAKNSPGFIVEKLYEKAIAGEKNGIIESIRAVGEIDTLKEKGPFYLFAIDAKQKFRYDRIAARKSETDQVSFDKFLEDENREKESTDPNKQNLSACIKRADFLFTNNGTKEDLESQIDVVMRTIKE